MEAFSPEDRLNEIWKEGRDLGLTDSEICHLLTVSVQEKQPSEPLQLPTSSETQASCSSLIIKSVKVLIKTLLFSVITLAIFGTVITTHNPSRKFVTRHIQDYIYPVMTRLRHLTLPVLNKFPTLSSWYSEECLLENPFFDQVNVDCNICSKNMQLEVVSNTEQFTEMYYNKGKFFIINHVGGSIQWNQIISKIDISSEEEQGSLKATGNYMHKYCNLKDHLANEIDLPKDIHIEWKVNKLKSLHVLRQLLPRFNFIPSDTEVSLHHLVFIDGPEYKPYAIPISEFSNVVLFQGEGNSVFTLEPSAHCKYYCQAVTLTLNTTQILFFNWIFWRPVRISGDGISTLFLSSFY
ncbi:uncharacterized protein [Palaemon carinicauda]|uniref:uncharacterized protein n=1 Tax=Palaemon carinicauda TaxID=392227 RepID=UPI0035B596F5